MVPKSIWCRKAFGAEKHKNFRLNKYFIFLGCQSKVNVIFKFKINGLTQGWFMFDVSRQTISTCINSKEKFQWKPQNLKIETLIIEGLRAFIIWASIFPSRICWIFLLKSLLKLLWMPTAQVAQAFRERQAMAQVAQVPS